MEIQEIKSFAEYHQDERFANKIPHYDKGLVVYKCGDNIYQHLSDGDFLQLQSMHSNNKKENPERKQHDLGGINVLISQNFCYFGKNAIELPQKFNDLKVGRAHKNKFPEELVNKFIKFISSYNKGIHAHPLKWPKNDSSWNQFNFFL